MPGCICCSRKASGILPAGLACALVSGVARLIYCDKSGIEKLFILEQFETVISGSVKIAFVQYDRIFANPRNLKFFKAVAVKEDQGITAFYGVFDFDIDIAGVGIGKHIPGLFVDIRGGLQGLQSL